MSFAYIPPPFPFPEAWPHIFQTPQTKWLSPSITTLPFPPPPVYPSNYSGASQYGAPHVSPFPPPESSSADAAPGHEETSESASHDSDSEVSSSSEGDDDGEFVYGYVLSDEWRGRFRNSLQARQRQQQQLRSQRQREQRAAAKEKQPIKQSNSTCKVKTRKQHFPSANDQRAMDLQREFAAATQRETTERRPIAPGELESSAPAAAMDVRRLETQLNLRFDEFCDAFLPVVWPHDAIHK